MRTVERLNIISFSKEKTGDVMRSPVPSGAARPDVEQRGQTSATVLEGIRLHAGSGRKESLR